jgi:hypothetical protein
MEHVHKIFGHLLKIVYIKQERDYNEANKRRRPNM